MSLLNPEAHLFERILSKICCLSQKNIITDDSYLLSYEQFLKKVEKLSVTLIEQSKSKIITFECGNTANDFIAICALLKAQISFILLPKSNTKLKQPAYQAEIPEFCEKILKVSNSSETFTVNDNKNYQTESFNKIINKSTGYIFLRTSGSMGKSKITYYTHENFIKNSENCIERFKLNKESRVAISVPIFHMYGLGAGLLPAFIAGANINIQSNVNILKFLENEKKFRPTTVFLNPTIIPMLLKFRRSKNPFDLSVSAGSALPDKLYEEYTKKFGYLINLYGSTELGAAATTLAPNPYKTPSYIKPLPHVISHISSQDKSLFLSHPYSFSGYLDDEGNEISVETRIYNTGDIADILENGYFRILGRQSDSINRDGFLVQLSDIENALLKVEGVKQATILTGNKENIRGKEVFAICITEKEQNVESIRKDCFNHLPRYAVPDKVILTNQFPLLSSGKVDKNTLKQQFIEH